jgi:HEAT repeat protein
MIVVFILAAPMRGRATVVSPQEESARAYREANKLILEEKWGDAIRSFQSLTQKFPKSDWVDDADFWICYATERTEPSPEKAFECYQRFLQTRPKSEWVNDAKLNMVRIAHQLAKLGKTEYEQKIRPFRDTGDQEVESAVLIALLDMGDEGSLAAVLARLDQIPKEEVRSKVVRQLGDHSQSPKVMAKLVELARKDSSVRVRRSAVQALAENKSQESITILRDIALSNDAVAVRKAALEELGDIETRKTEIIAVLKKIALSDPNMSLAESALDSLKDLKGAEALQALQALYSEAKTAELRRAVIRALGDREEDRHSALQFLIKAATSDSDPNVRRAAVSSIGDMDTREALEALKGLVSTNSDLETRDAVLRALGDYESDGVIEILVAFIKTEKDARLRRSAARALGETKKDAAVPTLIELARTDPNAEVRRSAVRALGEIRTPAAREALIKLLEQKKEE